jgi:serine/threonine protein kinase/TolA-binding protein
MDLAPGALLGSYRLIDRIGAGGMGEVWKGEDTRLGRIVAIKILPPALAADQESRARLQREARTAAHLYHPNIATIHAIEEAGDRLFIVMQYVEGVPLSHIIKRGPMAEAEICRIGKGVADALAEAHSQGIVHRDIKPDNIIVAEGRVKVLDFGIARHVGPPAPTGADDPTAFMTQQGIIVGTVFYMSPEQALGQPFDHRTDIFSLGVALYEAATGRLPFKGESITDTITRIVRDEPRPPMEVLPAVSPGLSHVIERCLQKKREDRYETAAQLAAALEGQFGRAQTDRSSIPVVPKTVADKASSEPTVVTSAPQAGASSPAPATERRSAALPSAPPSRRPRGSVFAAIAAVAVAGAAMAWFALFRGHSARTTAAEAHAAVQTAAPAPSSTVNVPAPAPAGRATIVEEPARTGSEPPTSLPAVANPERATASAAPAAPGPAETAATAPPRPAAENSAEPARGPETADSDGGASADELFAQGVRHLRNGDVNQAHKLFQRTVRKDPQYARAHLRLAEMMLLNRNLDGAAEEYARAAENEGRLNAREKAFLRLGSALATRDARTARMTARAIEQNLPGDPELAALQREFPGMLRDEGPPAERPGQRRRVPRP